MLVGKVPPKGSQSEATRLTAAARKFLNPARLEGAVCGGELGKSPGKSQFWARALEDGPLPTPGQAVSPQERVTPRWDRAGSILPHLLVGMMLGSPPPAGTRGVGTTRAAASALQGTSLDLPAPAPTAVPTLCTSPGVGCSRDTGCRGDSICKARQGILMQGALSWLLGGAALAPCTWRRAKPLGDISWTIHVGPTQSPPLC